MNFKKWVKSTQTAGYNGARTVIVTYKLLLFNAIIIHIYDNHIKFEVSLHFWRIWPTVRRRQCAAAAVVHGAGGSGADGEGQHRQA